MQMHSITVRVDATTHNEIQATAKARGLSVSDVVRQRLSTENSEQTNLLALLVSEIDEQGQQSADQQATLAAILSTLETLANIPPQPRTERAERIASPTVTEPPKPSPATPAKTATGEAWTTWIVRQPFADADGGSPSARGRRVWQHFEAETGNEAPPQFRSSAPRQ